MKCPPLLFGSDISSSIWSSIRENVHSLAQPTEQRITSRILAFDVHPDKRQQTSSPLLPIHERARLDPGLKIMPLVHRQISKAVSGPVKMQRTTFAQSQISNLRFGKDDLGTLSATLSKSARRNERANTVYIRFPSLSRYVCARSDSIK